MANETEREKLWKKYVLTFSFILSSLLRFYQQVYMILRPHVKEFLQSMAKIYEVCINMA